MEHLAYLYCRLQAAVSALTETQGALDVADARRFYLRILMLSEIASKAERAEHERLRVGRAKLLKRVQEACERVDYIMSEMRYRKSLCCDCDNE